MAAFHPLRPFANHVGFGQIVLELRVAYRDKPDLYGGPPTPEERRRARHVLWLFPPILLGLNLEKIARALGFKATREIALYGTILMGIICIVGAIISYRSAKKSAEQHIAELTNPEKR